VRWKLWNDIFWNLHTKECFTVITLYSIHYSKGAKFVTCLSKSARTEMQLFMNNETIRAMAPFDISVGTWAENCQLPRSHFRTRCWINLCWPANSRAYSCELIACTINRTALYRWNRTRRSPKQNSELVFVNIAIMDPFGMMYMVFWSVVWISHGVGGTRNLYKIVNW
jgi:hypothetical protein